VSRFTKGGVRREIAKQGEVAKRGKGAAKPGGGALGGDLAAASALQTLVESKPPTPIRSGVSGIAARLRSHDRNLAAAPLPPRYQTRSARRCSCKGLHGKQEPGRGHVSIT
jgi:hypothetical protein